jgi:hypothetical protein
MNCIRMFSKCECGAFVQPHSLWLTDKHCLLMSGLCVSCEKHYNVVFSLTDMYKNCPKPDIKQLEKAIEEKIDAIVNQVDFDVQFLHDLHIEGDVC